MVLMMTEGVSNSEVARRFRVSRPTVTMWRTRYRERGISGLHNELERGRPRSMSEERVAREYRSSTQARYSHPSSVHR